MKRNDEGTCIVRELLGEHGLQIDEQYRGETARLMDNAAYRMKYQRANGLTVDSLGELLWERHVFSERPTCNDVLELLDNVLRPAISRTSSADAGDRAIIAAAERAIEVRRHTRLRLYQCVGCGKKIRVADDHLDASHNHLDPDDGTLRVYPFALQTPVLREATPF
jgi:hypothetical protein